MKGKVVLITGGRRGIGKALALQFVKAGYKVAVVAKAKDADDLTSEVIDTLGGTLLYYGIDLSQPQQRMNAVQTVVNQYGTVDILINNAGHQHFTGAAQDYPLDAFRKDYELNVTAALDLAQQCYPYMKASGWGRIVNLASIVSFHGSRNSIGYPCAKTALLGLTRCLSNEWACQGITVNAVAPGYIETDMLKPLTSDEVHANVIRKLIPVGRFGQPDEVASVIKFLCSDDARYISGECIMVDGGWMAR